MSRCVTCGRAAYSIDHRCPPAWDAYEAKYGDGTDCEKVYASNAPHAATVLAEASDCDSAEYEIANGQPAVIMVRPHASDDPWQGFEVTGEAQPVYYAKPITAHEPAEAQTQAADRPLGDLDFL